jgi:hypothetical protein
MLTEQSSLDTIIVTIWGVGVGTAWKSLEMYQKFVYEGKNYVETAIVFLSAFAHLFFVSFELR